MKKNFRTWKISEKHTKLSASRSYVKFNLKFDDFVIANMQLDLIMVPMLTNGKTCNHLSFGPAETRGATGGGGKCLNNDR